jgi:methionine synthase I (cobalamin-dependent)
LTDGAWGTELQKRGLRPGEPADLWNLTRPDVVGDIARSYVAAGSRVILTNTFRANPIALSSHGRADDVVAINRRGVELSRSALAGSGRVFASLGPTGKLLSAGEIDAGSVARAFTLQARALADAGADALLFETFSDLEEARIAIDGARPTGLPVLVSFAFDTGKGRDRTMMGHSPEQVAAAMESAGVDAVGANCGAGPDAFVNVCRRLRSASQLPLWIKPNAGLPVIHNGQAVYTMTPAEFAAYLPALVDAGAAFLGGCCGTTPDFIAALAQAAGACAFS